MYPAFLIGARAVALMEVRMRLGLISGQAFEQPNALSDFGGVS